MKFILIKALTLKVPNIIFELQFSQRNYKKLGIGVSSVFMHSFKSKMFVVQRIISNFDLIVLEIEKKIQNNLNFEFFYGKFSITWLDCN